MIDDIEPSFFLSLTEKRADESARGIYILYEPFQSESNLAIVICLSTTERNAAIHADEKIVKGHQKEMEILRTTLNELLQKELWIEAATLAIQKVSDLFSKK